MDFNRNQITHGIEPTVKNLIRNGSVKNQRPSKKKKKHFFFISRNALRSLRIKGKERRENKIAQVQEDPSR